MTKKIDDPVENEIIPDEVPPAVEYDNAIAPDDLGSDPTKPRGKYP